MSDTPTNPPVAFGIATAAAASVLPVAWLMDQAVGQGGDGLGGFGAISLFLLAALAATVTGVAVGYRRKERFPWLAQVALALWLLPVVVMMV